MLRFTGGKHRRLVDSLVTAYGESAAGAAGRMLVLAGEAGSGKTRIVQEFYRELAEAQEKVYWPPNGLDTDDAEFIKGRKRIHPNQVSREELPDYMWWAISCQQGADGDPIQSLADDQTQLEQHCGPVLEAVLAREDAVGRVRSILVTGLGTFFPLVGWIDSATGIGADLMALVADVKARNPKVSGTQDVDANDNERAELVDSLFQFVSEVASPELPIVMVVDDAHDADPSCIKLIRKILEPGSGVSSVLIVATAWGSKLGEESPIGSFGRLVADLESSGAVEQHRVPPLTDEDIQIILDDVAPSVSEELASAMRDRTDGNPLVLNGVLNTEWVKDDLAEGDLEVSDLRGADLPSTAIDVFRKSWEEMPKRTRDALALSSLQGLRFLAELTELSAKRGTDQGVVSEALSSAINPYGWAEEFSEAFQFSQTDFFHIASERGDQFLSPRDREAALRKGILWLKDWLRNTVSPPSSDQELVALSVALHVGSQVDLDSDDPEDRELQDFIIECSLRLVDRQFQQGLPDGCIKTMRDGLRLAEQFYGRGSEEAMKLQVEWGWVCRDLGEYETGIGFFEKILKSNQLNGNFEAAAREGLCCLYCDDGRHSESLQECDWLINLHKEPGRDLGDLLLYRSNRAIQNRCLGHGGDRDLSRLAVEEMNEINEIKVQSKLPVDEADRLELELSLVESNYGPESLEAFEASLELGLCYLGIPSIAQADYHLERALSLSGQLSVSPGKLLQLQVAKSIVEFERGRIAASKQHFREARELRGQVPASEQEQTDTTYRMIAGNLGVESF